MFCYQSSVLSRHSEILLFKMVGENSFPDDDDDDFRRIELPETNTYSILSPGWRLSRTSVATCPFYFLNFYLFFKISIFV